LLGRSFSKLATRLLFKLATRLLSKLATWLLFKLATRLLSKLATRLLSKLATWLLFKLATWLQLNSACSWKYAIKDQLFRALSTSHSKIYLQAPRLVCRSWICGVWSRRLRDSPSKTAPRLHLKSVSSREQLAIYAIYVWIRFICKIAVEEVGLVLNSMHSNRSNDFSQLHSHLVHVYVGIQFYEGGDSRCWAPLWIRVWIGQGQPRVQAYSEHVRLLLVYMRRSKKSTDCYAHIIFA
jgi:hypothetical protein